MRCPACQADNLGDSLFCDECGGDLEAVCPSCAAGNRATAKFCRKCRTPLRSVAAPASPSTPTSPASLPPAATPPPAPGHLAERILQQRSTLQGERKQVTVLFADVKGSMELAEQLDPEDWSRLMQRFFAILCEGVERFEGFVDKFTGDGIMALFGAPLAHEDHAQRACYAALHLQAELARHAKELKREHGVGFSTRMGLHSGEVVVGSIGDDLRMEYTAQGHTVGLAQRMESLASPDTCYLSASTAALVRGYVALEDLGEFRVKGLREPVGVHRLAGVGTSTTRFDLSRSRGLTRFVGRDRDMQRLEEALAEAQSGQGQVIGIVAEAGTGKSRLCHEFAERARARGLTVNFGSALSHGRYIPYLPILQVFRAFYGIADDDSDRTVRERIAGKLLLADPGVREMLPVAFEFFGVPDPALPAPRLDPDAKMRAVFAMLKQGIRDAESSAHRLVVVIEDLHWLDAASEAILAAWVEALEGSSALLVVNFRPEYRAEWMERPWYRRLPVAPLGPEATRELLGHLLGDDASVAGLAEHLHRQTGGNPFFTEEMVRAMVDAGDLVGKRGAYRLVVDAATIRVPASVHGILAARIDRLPEREKLVLQTAAVLGQTFPAPLLNAVSELPEDEVRAALSVLQAAGFVYEETPFPVAKYAFQHPLTCEVALRSQLQERRRRLHAAAARAIEAAHADKLDAHAALLAHHHEEAGAALAAAGWQMRAAGWVRGRDSRAAAGHARRALELVRRAPDSPETPDLGANICRELLAAGLRTNLGPEEVDAIFAQGLAWAESSGNRDSVARLHQSMAVLSAALGNLLEARDHAEQWNRIVLESGNDELRACAKWPLIAPAYSLGDLAAEKELIEWQIEATRDHPHWGMKDWSLSAAANAYIERSRVERMEGNLAAATRSAEEGMRIARIAEDAEMHFWAMLQLALILQTRGDVDASRMAVQRLGSGAPEGIGEYVVGDMHSTFAAQLLLEGRADEALRALDALLEDEDSPVRQPLTRVALRFRQSQALRAAGQGARARSVAEATCEETRKQGLLLTLLPTLGALVQVMLDEGEPGDLPRVDALLDEGEELVRRCGARLFEPSMLEQRAALAGLRGDSARRIGFLRKAISQYEAMGADGHAARLAAVLAGA